MGNATRAKIALDVERVFSQVFGRPSTIKDAKTILAMRISYMEGRILQYEPPETFVAHYWAEGAMWAFGLNSHLRLSPEEKLKLIIKEKQALDLEDA